MRHSLTLVLLFWREIKSVGRLFELIWIVGTVHGFGDHLGYFLNMLTQFWPHLVPPPLGPKPEQDRTESGSLVRLKSFLAPTMINLGHGGHPMSQWTPSGPFGEPNWYFEACWAHFLTTR